VTKVTELLIHQWSYFRKKLHSFIWKETGGPWDWPAALMMGIQRAGVVMPERGILMAFLTVPCLQVQEELQRPSMHQTPDTFLVPHKAKGYLNSWSGLEGHWHSKFCIDRISRINTCTKGLVEHAFGGAQIREVGKKFYSSFHRANTLDS
jgi:hypothetical protein